MSSKSSKIREKYAKIISDKLEDSVAKFGTILAQGIIDAGNVTALSEYLLDVSGDCNNLYIGGRNVIVSLQSRTGHTHMPTVVCLLVFPQFWFWYPLSLFLSLAFTPTAVIGLNSNLQVGRTVCSYECTTVYIFVCDH